jgi:hypothetical protein
MSRSPPRKKSPAFEAFNEYQDTGLVRHLDEAIDKTHSAWQSLKNSGLGLEEVQKRAEPYNHIYVLLEHYRQIGRQFVLDQAVAVFPEAFQETFKPVQETAALLYFCVSLIQFQRYRSGQDLKDLSDAKTSSHNAVKALRVETPRLSGLFFSLFMIDIHFAMVRLEFYTKVSPQIDDLKDSRNYLKELLAKTPQSFEDSYALAFAHYYLGMAQYHTFKSLVSKVYKSAKKTPAGDPQYSAQDENQSTAAKTSYFDPAQSNFKAAYQSMSSDGNDKVDLGLVAIGYAECLIETYRDSQKNPRAYKEIDRSSIRTEALEKLMHVSNPVSVSIPLLHRIHAAYLAAELLAEPKGDATTSPERLALLRTATIYLRDASQESHLARDDVQTLIHQSMAASHSTPIAALTVALILETESFDSASARAAMENALLMFEQGRGILANQIMDYRTPTPYASSSDSDGSQPKADPAPEKPRLTGDERKEYRTLKLKLWSQFLGTEPLADATKLTDEWNKIITKIRKIDRRFLENLTINDMKALAKTLDGTIIAVNPAPIRSDAFIINAERVSTIHLRNLDYEFLETVMKVFEGKVRSPNSDRDAFLVEVEPSAETLDFSEWLWNAIVEPTLTAANLLQPPGPSQKGELPRVWWVVGGSLSLFPLHMAEFNGKKTMDFVVSSYSPTIRALHHALAFAAKARQAAGKTNVLVVSMPQTPGQTSLPGTADEMKAIVEIFSKQPAVGKYQLNTKVNPGKIEVLKALPDSPIAHFACHGCCSRVNPSESSLKLNQSELKALEVARIHMEHAQLAYLSACDTARHGVKELLDENIHIAGSFQLAGYPRTVASLWKISDTQAVDVARNYYTTWINKYSGDLKQSARALHEALLVVKQNPGQRDHPLNWAAYAHYGLEFEFTKMR